MLSEVRSTAQTPSVIISNGEEGGFGAQNALGSDGLTFVVGPLPGGGSGRGTLRRVFHEDFGFGG